MDRRLVVVSALVALAAAAYPTMGAPPGPPQERAFTFDVTAFPCSFVSDGVCLGYGGAIPGPMLDVNLGDTLVVTLVNRIAETLPPGAPPSLADARVSWHVHGTAVSVASDGVGASSAAPGGSFTFTTRAAFAGDWHYHDHVIGFDGDEGTRRGLYGGLLVRTAGEPRPDAVFDVHLTDRGVNGGAGMSGEVAAGGDFEILVVGLENFPWSFELRSPSNALVASLETWPGLSERLRVEDAEPGVYKWTARGAGTHRGEVVVS